ncbi:MAG: hypothetical protein C0394_00020 [Syntrophus sp. (in: bacteria)]|nr:hypothetical protein [Syntrophus sp. (in: bacteria)]
MTFLLLFLSMLIPLLAGLIVTALFFPPRRLDAATGFFHLSLAAGVGLGVLSCLYFVAMLATHAGVLVYLDAALVVVLIVPAIFLYQKGFLRREGVVLPEENVPLKYRFIFPVMFGGTLISGLISIAVAFLKEPHGKWDAWVIWNLHARFILRGGERWQDFLSSGLEWTHPDYPLLVPLSIVRMWKYAGSETLYGPIVLSVLFTLAVAGLLVFSLATLRSRAQGYLAGLVLMGSPFFLDMGAYQFADIPLAFFFLATLVIFFQHDRFSERHDYPLMLAGLAAALAAWTKNEGLLFLLCVPPARFAWIVRSVGRRRALRQAAWFAAGALPVLMVIAFFKLQLAPSSDIFAGQGLQPVLDRLTDWPRYGQVLLAYIQTALTFTQGIVNIREGFRFNPLVAGVVLLGVYLILMGVRKPAQDRPALLTGATVILLMLAGYFGIYLITPHDLRWHLLTSLNRLFIQLWPAAIFLCFMVARAPEQALARGVIREMDQFLSRQNAPSGPKKEGVRKQKRRRP